MRLRAGATVNRTLRCTAIATAAACAFTAWSVDQDSIPASASADVIALRFPTQAEAVAPPAEHRAAADREAADRALLSPRLTYPHMAALSQGAPPAPPAVAPAPKAPPAQPAAATAKPPVVADRNNHRPSSVLNEAQIASMKRRLNLTPEQERMWPSVEAALRRLAYAKSQERSRKDGGSGAIDLAGTDVEQLKSAAFPLIMSFSDDQRRELVFLAHVAGLEKLVPQF